MPDHWRALTRIRPEGRSIGVRARRLPLLIAAIPAVAVLALSGGCGGGQSEVPGDAPEVAQFRSAADAICKEAVDGLDALGAPVGAGRLGSYIRAGLVVSDAQLAKLRALRPPPRLRADFAGVVASLDARQSVISGIADRIASGEHPARVLSSTDSEIEATHERFRAKAEALGLVDCGRDDVTVRDGSPESPEPVTRIAAAATFARDSETIGDALEAYSSTLTGIDDRAQFVGERAALETATDRLADAVEKMGTYELDDVQLESTREIIVELSVPMIAQMRRLSEAGGRGSPGAIRASAARFEQSARALAAALTGAG